MSKCKKTGMFRIVLACLVGLVGGCGEDEKGLDPITVGGPQSLSGKYLETAGKTINGAKAAIKWVNEVHGGVQVGGKSTTIELMYDDDESDSAKVEEITNAMCADETVGFIMAPYSSGLTKAAAPIAEACQKPLLVPGGASNSIYNGDYSYVAASIGPASQYHKGILDAVAAAAGSVDGLKVALAYEDASFAKSVRDGAVDYAESLGFTIGHSGVYPAGADETSTELADLCAAIAADVPDIVLGGGHSVDGRALTNVLAAEGVAPSAFSLLVAPVSEDFYNLVEPCPDPCDYANHPAEGVSGPSHWEVGVSFSESSAAAAGKEWFGPSQTEFLSLYHDVAGQDQTPSYHSGNGAVMILSLVLAIEKAKSTDPDTVLAELKNLEFMSFWGMWDIDQNGANTGHAMVEVQWQEGQLEIVWPDSGKTADFVYPIN